MHNLSSEMFPSHRSFRSGKTPAPPLAAVLRRLRCRSLRKAPGGSGWSAGCGNPIPETLEKCKKSDLGISWNTAWKNDSTWWIWRKSRYTYRNWTMSGRFDLNFGSWSKFQTECHHAVTTSKPESYLCPPTTSVSIPAVTPKVRGTVMTTWRPLACHGQVVWSGRVSGWWWITGP